jgi:hypothetical protein
MVYGPGFAEHAQPALLVLRRQSPRRKAHIEVKLRVTSKHFVAELGPTPPSTGRPLPWLSNTLSPI